MKNNLMKILVTGGCGYIGSHTIADLITKGHSVVSADNFYNGHIEVLDHIEELTGVQVQNYDVDLTDLEKTKKIFADHPDINGIIHFAAMKYVGESTELPLTYYRNNLNSLINILDCQASYKVPNLVFSSSCSIYGNPEKLPVTESTPFQEAESPYARTKQIGEQIISDFHKANPSLNYILLRYFNPAGIHSSGILKENAKKEIETLVPIIDEVYKGKRKELVIFGGDYPTRDGTCIRDYIHVEDVAEAHTLALQSLQKSNAEGSLEIYNVGTGNGVTVLEMVKAMEKVSKSQLNYKIGDRRAGDVVQVFADYKKAKTDFGWTPKRNIEDIFASIL